MGSASLLTSPKSVDNKDMVPMDLETTASSGSAGAVIQPPQPMRRAQSDHAALNVSLMESLPHTSRSRAQNKRPHPENSDGVDGLAPHQHGLDRDRRPFRSDASISKRESSEGSLSSSKHRREGSTLATTASRRASPETERVAATPDALDPVDQNKRSSDESPKGAARSDVALLQDTVKRVNECIGKVDLLQRAGNLTALELKSFRQEYQRQIEAVLTRLDTLGSGLNKRTTINLPAITEADIHQLRDELTICKDELMEMEPRRAAVENEFFQRMERFSTQLDHVRLQMTKTEQDLLRENDMSRLTLQNQMARQMAQFRQSQGADNKRLREEMDELRSDMCEILKEMHLLKERTKYLGREGGRRQQPPLRQSSISYNRFPDTLRHSTTAPTLYSSGGCTSHICSRVPPPYDNHVQVHSGHDDLYCQHHHCPAGIPHGEPIEHIATRQPSPPRLTQSALLQAAAARPSNEHHDLRQFCPSPHYSSRSSSVSGRISVTRDETVPADEHADGPALERRLLEQHRLFWIGEGAGSVSQLSMEQPTAKFPEDERDEEG